MTDDANRPVRRFRARNLLVLPQGLYAGPGATNMRLDPDEVVELDADAVQQHERYINGRIRAGDLEEVEVRETLEPASHTTVASPRRATRDVEMTVGKPDKESGR